MQAGSRRARAAPRLLAPLCAVLLLLCVATGTTATTLTQRAQTTTQTQQQQAQPILKASFTPEYAASAPPAAAVRTSPSAAGAALSSLVRASTGAVLKDALVHSLARREQRVKQSDNFFDQLQHGAFTVAAKIAPQAAAAVAQAAAAATPKTASLSSASSSSVTAFSEGRVPVSHRQLSGGFGSNLGTFDLTDAQKADVRARYGTDSAAIQMREQSPRFGPSKMDFTTDGSGEKDPFGIGINMYLYGIIVCFLIGIGIAFGQFILTGFYMFFRCCCWRWLCKKRSDHELEGFQGWPTKFKKNWPMVGAGLCILLACTFAIVGIVYNDGVSKTFSTTDQQNGVGPLVLNAMNSLDSKLSSIVAVLDHITTDIPVIQGALTNTVNDIGSVGTASTGLKGVTSDFGTTYGSPNANNDAFASYGVSANGSTWYCDATCVGLGTASATMGTEIDNQVQPTFADFASTLDDVNTAFLDAANEITSTLTDAKESMASATDGVTDQGAKDSVTDNTDMVEGYDNYRNIAFVVLFSVVFVTPVLAGLALSSKKGWPFKCNFCLGPFYLFLVWILFGLHWMLGMLIGDGCVYMDDTMVDMRGGLGDAVSGSEVGTLASVINACLVNASLITALNLTGQLDFANLIQFPEMPSQENITAKFDFSGFNAIESAANGLSESNFYRLAPDGTPIERWNSSKVNDPLATMSSMLTGGAWWDAPNPILYTRADVRSNRTAGNTWFTTNYAVGDQPAILAAADEAFNAMQIEDTLAAAAEAVRTDTARIDSNITALTQRMKDVVSKVSNQSDPDSVFASLEPLFGRVHEFENVANCGFVADVFGSFKSTLCNQLEKSIQFITLSLFLIGLSCFGITWFSRWSAYRVQFVPRVAPAPFDENAWMQANGGAGGGEGGVQMAVMDDGQGGGMAGTASGQGAYGGAVQVPPYQAALASYNNHDGQEGGQHDTAGAVGEEAPLRGGDDAASAPADSEVAASPSAAASPPAQDFPFGKCESCENQPAMVTCVECDEKLCMECDNTLHMIVANAQHDRTMLA
jgi:hypothetical protein